jgi:SPP1 family predicted phage head-tail adaptor
MRAGKLDRSITIQREATTTNDTGYAVAAWSDLANIRAEIVTQTSTEFLTGYGEAENGTVIFRVRYLAGITTADRVTHGGEIYDLKEITEIGRRRALELRAVATS